MGRVVADAEGRPVIEGTRITIDLVLDRLASGESPAEVARAYPGLTEQGVRAALEYAAEIVKQRSVLHDPSNLCDDWDDLKADDAYDQGR